MSESAKEPFRLAVKCGDCEKWHVIGAEEVLERDGRLYLHGVTILEQSLDAPSSEADSDGH